MAMRWVGELRASRPARPGSVEVSAYVRDDLNRRGIGRALYSSLVAVLPLQSLEMPRF